MAVMFSAARIDERGRISGGQAGDQTGNEVSTVKAYMHNLGWRVFRYPNSTIASWIGKNAKFMADNNNFGYDQLQRTTGYQKAIEAGWEPRNVKSLCELDCSELVRTAIACAMEKQIPDFNTANEANVLLNLGFKEVTNWTLNNLQLGDILVTKTKGHTEIVSQGATPTINQTPSAQTISYYNKYKGKSTSIVEGLAAVGEKDITLTHRKKIAFANGIYGYTGTPAQNTKMLNLLKQGKLIKA